MKPIVPAVFLALFAVLVAAKVHGFSVGVWNLRAYVPDTVPSYSFLEIGVPRPIRSDEWSVSTPQVLAQCESPDFFPRVNRRVDGGTDMFLATPCNPVWDWTVPGQFQNWGYFLFGAERGLAWNWWCRYLGIPFFAYLFFLGWLGRDRLLAVTASLAVALGAPTQWWDTTLPYLLLYFFSGLVFFRIVVSRDARVLAKGLASLGLFVSLASYAFAGYPPFAILLFPAFLLLGWQVWRRENPPGAVPAPVRGRGAFLLRPRFWLAAVLLALAAEFAYFAVVHADTLRTIAGSAYPGRRFALGGSFHDFLRHRALEAVCPFFSWPGFNVNPDLWSEPNVCRAARWFVPGTGLVFLFALRWPGLLRLQRSDWLLAAAGLWLFAWSAFRFPPSLARASGMFPFPAHRAEVVAGFYFLLFSFRTFVQSGGPAPDRRRPAALAAALSVAILVCGVLLPGGKGGFFVGRAGILFLAGGAVLCAAVTAGLVSGVRWLFCCGYLALSIAGGVMVHPLSVGISPLRDKELAVLVREIDAREPGRWMANEPFVGNFLLAQGVDCRPGTQQYANPDFWNVLDPEGAYEREWNRYAHCAVALSQDGTFHAKAAGVVLRFAVTERNLRDLGISHLVWFGKKLHEPWLRYEGRSRLHFVYTLLPERD